SQQQARQDSIDQQPPQQPGRPGAAYCFALPQQQAGIVDASGQGTAAHGIRIWQGKAQLCRQPAKITDKTNEAFRGQNGGLPDEAVTAQGQTQQQPQQHPAKRCQPQQMGDGSKAPQGTATA